MTRTARVSLVPAQRAHAGGQSGGGPMFIFNRPMYAVAAALAVALLVVSFA